MKDDYTHLTLVVDRSGSMRSTCADAQGGIDQFIVDQRRVPGKCTLTLIDFDSEHRTLFDGDIEGYQGYRLVPRGSTALLDAIAYAVRTTGFRLKRMMPKMRPAKVVVVIVTDGHENASVETTVEEVKAMVAEQELTYNWQFVFIGSTLDAVITASSYGIANAGGFVANGVSTRAVYAGLSYTVSNYRTTAGAQSMNQVASVDEHGQTVP